MKRLLQNLSQVNRDTSGQNLNAIGHGDHGHRSIVKCRGQARVRGSELRWVKLVLVEMTPMHK